MFETALATRQESEAILGALDVTPTFSGYPTGPTATAFPTDVYSRFPAGVYSRPAIRSRHPRVLDFNATSIAPLGQMVQHLYGLASLMNQTPIESDSELFVVPLSVRPSEVIGDFLTWEPSIIEAPPSPARAALSAVEDVQRWLAIGQDQVATLAGYAPRSVKNWREGMDPYSSTVRRLFDLHALLGSLTHRMGVEGARLWLADVSHSGAQRREQLADDAGLRSVISEASARLFEQPSVPPIHALDFDEEPEPETPRRPDLFSGPVRRARLRP